MFKLWQDTFNRSMSRQTGPGLSPIVILSQEMPEEFEDDETRGNFLSFLLALGTDFTLQGDERSMQFAKDLVGAIMPVETFKDMINVSMESFFQKT